MPTSRARRAEHDEMGESAIIQLAAIKAILEQANTRTMAADRLYALYPELDNTTATRRARELNHD